jgi:pimeloyl-ACP methyl ester carboxylesterase
MKGMKFSLTCFWDEVMKSNLFRDVPSQSVPVYIMQGTSDYQTAFLVAKEYFDSLQAPIKRFYPFENSAHSPIFEEPVKFEEILRKILIAEQK